MSKEKKKNHDEECKKWLLIYYKHFKSRYRFWTGKGYDRPTSIKKALAEIRKVKRNPFSPKEELVNQEILNEFCQNWENVYKKLVSAIKNGTYDMLRYCDSCGLPMSEGYYLAGEYACDEECCLECYHGNKAQMEEDLSHAEENCSDIYWTEWGSIFFDDWI